jgi:hypothetical protein
MRWNIWHFCTMEMTIGSEAWQQGGSALKGQCSLEAPDTEHTSGSCLPAREPSIRREVAAESYRDLQPSGSGNPGTTAVRAEGHLQVSSNCLSESSIVTSENSTDEGFVTVLSQKRGKPSLFSLSVCPTPSNKHRTP